MQRKSPDNAAARFPTRNKVIRSVQAAELQAVLIDNDNFSDGEYLLIVENKIQLMS